MIFTTLAGSVESSIIKEYKLRNPCSLSLYARASHALAGGSTRSSVFYSPFPVYMDRGQGCKIWDVDGNERIDFLNNYTALIHGHCPPQVIEPVKFQLERGMAFASPTDLEVQLAELIKQRIPSMERLRFTNSGTEGVILALRAARAFTGRNKIAKFKTGYHGACEYVSVGITPDLDDVGRKYPATSVPDGPGIPPGILEDVVTIPFNDRTSVENILGPMADSFAAVIVEPVLGAAGIIPPEDGFLEFLRDFTASHRILLIFDEIIAFRISYHGAQGFFGVTPDLTVLGKVIGGGLPVGAFGGRADVMSMFDSSCKNWIRHSGTCNGNPLTMTAGIANLKSLSRETFKRIEGVATHIAIGLTNMFEKNGFPASVTQIGSMFNIHAAGHFSSDQAAGERLMKSIHLGMLNNGIFLSPQGMGCISTPMGQLESDALLEAMGSVIKIIIEGAVA